ncbi:malamycin response protein 1 [Phaeosphaeriaceae sp. PMI808]|nr:malamycin response protein 1 [Phaeosphaeriaceae sp. PMI808]
MTASNEHRRKIRDSCNNCSAQKIRCGKQRPSCARCASKKLQCNYSYSQRTGRRSSSTIAQKEVPQVAFLPAILDSPVATCDPNAMYGSTLSLTPTSPQPAQAANALAESPLDIDPNPFDDSNFFPDPTFDFLISVPNTETAHSRSSSTNIPTTKTSEAAQLIDPESLWQPLIAPSSDFTFEALKSVSNHPIFDQDHVAPFQQPLEKKHQRGHDCMALALQVVNTLSIMREPCKTATLDPMTCIESSKTEIRDVDTVLFFNRDAAQSVKKILDCPCSNDRTVSLACYLATSKIVEWYGAAIEAVGERSEQPDHYITKVQPPKSSQYAMAECIIARPIYMGKYCLDSDVQRAVRAQVVLGELKEHVQPLLNRLPHYHVTGIDADNDPASNSIQACVLRNQLRTVIQSARSLNGGGNGA